MQAAACSRTRPAPGPPAPAPEPRPALPASCLGRPYCAGPPRPPSPRAAGIVRRGSLGAHQESQQSETALLCLARDPPSSREVSAHLLECRGVVIAGCPRHQLHQPSPSVGGSVDLSARWGAAASGTCKGHSEHRGGPAGHTMRKKARSILQTERLRAPQAASAPRPKKRKAPDAAAGPARQHAPRDEAEQPARKVLRTNAAAEAAAAPAAARGAAPQPPPQPDGQHKPWWPSSVIDRQAAQALARLLGAHAAGRGGASIKVRAPRSLVGHAR